MTYNQQRWKEIIDGCRNVEEIMSNFLLNVMSPDDLACLGARPSMGSYVQVWILYAYKIGTWQFNRSITTVGTPYNTVPYTTGSNIARLGHGSQNSWSKLWIPFPVVKEILNRFLCVLLSREKVSPQENSW